MDDAAEVVDTARSEGSAPESKRPALPEPFVTLMRSGWADPEEGEIHPIDALERHAARRRALSAALPNETLVIPTGNLRTRSNDTEYEFRPGTDFVYLTGCSEPDAVLVMSPRADGGHTSTLYLRCRSSRDNDDFFRNYHGELWVGRRHTAAGYSALYGIESRDLAELPVLWEKLTPHDTRLRRGLDAGVDAALPPLEDDTRDKKLVSILAEQRIVKDAWEIKQLQDAVDATLRGFADIVRALPEKEAVSERVADAAFLQRARHDGHYVGYGTISAGGAHACTLHWVRNDTMVHPGELLLVDAGVENRNYYTADITRTLPISGKFSDTQRRIYEIVYRAQQAGFEAVKPGVTWEDVHLACMRVLAEGLEELEILAVSAEESLRRDNQTYRRWTLHTFGHRLGIDVHDCLEARKEHHGTAPLRVGETLTVEPGLYFQPDDLLVPEEYRGIGVRIEDDVVVTEDGCRVLSEALPREASAVETWMAELRER